VRSLAMALNIKYKKMNDNEVSHSNLLSVLDTKGRIIFQQLADISEVKDISNKISVHMP
jgi:protein SCO1/2